MTPLLLAALVALAPPPSVDCAAAIEHVPLPSSAGALAVRVDALGRAVVLETADPAALARALRRTPRALCPGVEEAPGEVRLRCRSTRLVAHLAPRESGALLDVRETRALPWGGDTAPPLVALDPGEVGLGAPCPGSTPEGRAECRLAAGDLPGARDALVGLDTGAAALRLGDLAFADGDPRGAASQWARAHGQPWERLAAARLCELEAACLSGPRAEALYDPAGLPPSAARDLLARRARALAFEGRALEAARMLLDGAAGRAACAAAVPLCRRVALAAIGEPDPAGSEALALWLALPDRDRDLYELEAETARAAERAGAPLFAAAVLASAVGLAPRAALPEHLLRTAELYLAGGDRVRAGVVYEFARSRGGDRGIAGARWAAVAKGAGVRDGRARAKATNATANSNSTATATATATGDPDLLAAARATARAHTLSEGATP